MMTHIDLRLLPSDLCQHVLEVYRVAIKQENHRMTYQEAAWLYGYTYLTIRSHVARGRIRTVGRTPDRRITHAAMRTYIQRKRRTGCPRKALKNAQHQIP